MERRIHTYKDGRLVSEVVQEIPPVEVVEIKRAELAESDHEVLKAVEAMHKALVEKGLLDAVPGFAELVARRQGARAELLQARTDSRRET